jgi:hypothetical protein
MIAKWIIRPKKDWVEIVTCYKYTGREEQEYICRYEKTVKYCPECGKQNVWFYDGYEDYYTSGKEYYCLECGAYGEDWRDVSDGTGEKQIIELLRLAKDGKEHIVMRDLEK